MKRASKFAISPNWKLMLLDMGIDVEKALKYAELPADLFSRRQMSITPEGFFQLWGGVEQAAEGKDLPLLFAEHFSAEAFDAPIFASICSPDMKTALQRLRDYKPLIGPMLMDIETSKKSIDLKLTCYGYQGALPQLFSLTELVFFTQLVRMATRENIIPLMVGLPALPEDCQAYNQYFGTPLKVTPEVSISFSVEDASKPFLTSNAAMWEFFEDKLNRKLADMNVQSSAVERVRAVLLESLPAGESSIEMVAGKLAMSKRTLQRKLTAESESYQSVLIRVRQELADHYLEKSEMTLGEISFLLGFQEANSFIRAYSSWKGVSPGQYRDQFH